MRVEVDEVAHRYAGTVGEVMALQPISFTVEPGTMVALFGRSGSGKTTLLNAIGGLLVPSRGRVMIGATEVSTLSESKRLELRRRAVSYIFQGFGLLPGLTAYENVELPLRLHDLDRNERRERVEMLLDRTGMGNRARHLPGELSGGEMQRVAIARALAARPAVLLADEPTGQLDSRTGRIVVGLMAELVAEQGLTAIVATHDPNVVEVADRIITIDSSSPVPSKPA